MNHNTNKEIVTDEKKLLHDFMQRLFLGSITKLMGFRIPHIINSAHINEF